MADTTANGAAFPANDAAGETVAAIAEADKISAGGYARRASRLESMLSLIYR
jgi:hypothetical protein